MLVILFLTIAVTNGVFANTDISGTDMTSLAFIIERLSLLEEENQELKTRLSTLEHQVDRQANEIASLKKVNNKHVEQLAQLTDKKPSTSEAIKNIAVATKTDADSGQDKVQNRRVSGRHSNRIRRENEMNVAFFATLSNHIDNPGVHQMVTFDHVITNHGNGYNSHAGDFRAPVAGTYVFAVTLMAGSTSTPYHYSVMRNNIQVSRIYIVNGGTGSKEVILDLAQGDDVAIHHLDAGQRLYGHSYTTFSGFLLYQNYTVQPVVG